MKTDRYKKLGGKGVLSRFFLQPVLCEKCGLGRLCARNRGIWVDFVTKSNEIKRKKVYRTMFYRNVISELKKWANEEDRKPLILRGARQVGGKGASQEIIRADQLGCTQYASGGKLLEKV